MSPKTLPQTQIPRELAIEILALLPVKPLVRWKCACKSWFNLISNDPQFAKLHLHYAKHDTSVNRYRLFLSTFPLRSVDHDAFCYGNNLATRELNFPIVDVQPTHFSVIGTYNGLIAAFWHDEPLCEDMNPAKNIIVWNPTTGDFRELPPPPPSNSSIPGYKIFYGFGYDSNLDDYKIVRGLISTCGKEVQIDVLYLKTREWRSSRDVVHSSFSLHCLVQYSSSNGFMHWLLDFPYGKLGIVSFDLGEEEFLEMVPVPDDIKKKLSGFTVREVGDNVCVCNHAGSPEDYFEGWMMKRDGSEIWWTKLYNFRAYPLLPIGSDRYMEVIWVAKNGNVVLHVEDGKLLLYNPKQHSSLEYGVKSCGQISYMETLVSPNAS